MALLVAILGLVWVRDRSETPRKESQNAGAERNERRKGGLHIKTYRESEGSGPVDSLWKKRKKLEI